MGHQHMHARELIIGAAVGSLLGGLSVLLIAPKSGAKLRKDICDAYCDIAEKTHDFTDKGKSLAKGISCQTCDWASKARSIVDDASKKVKGWVSEEEEEDESTRDLLIGGVIGGVVGATVGLLLAPKSGEELRQDFVDTYEDISEKTHDFTEEVSKKGKSFAKTANSKVNKWLDLAKNIVDELSEEAQEKGEDWLDNIKDLVNNKKMNDVLSWAHLGYRAWKGISKKRR